MLKNFFLAFMAAVALAAIALPAGAQAANKPTLKDKGGVLPAGAKIVGTSVGEIIFWNTSTSAATFFCNAAKFTGEVTKNKEDAVEAKITTADLWGGHEASPDNNLGECTENPLGKFYVTFLRMPLIFKSTAAMATDEFQLSGTGGNIRMILGFTTAGECEYETTPSAIKGDFTTSESQSSLTIRDTEAGSGFKVIRGGFLCPTSFVLGMTLNLETETGEPAWIVKTP